MDELKKKKKKFSWIRVLSVTTVEYFDRITG